MSKDVTELLGDFAAGDQSALDQLASRLYPDLKRMAARRSRQSAGMGSTTLVQETFVELLRNGTLAPDSRQQFFALAATVMRRIIVDEIRYVLANKRQREEVTLVHTILGDDAHDKAMFLLEVDEMMSVLESEDPRLAKAFECRYFAGMTIAETAQSLDVSERSAERIWSRSRARIAELIESSNA